MSRPVRKELLGLAVLGLAVLALFALDGAGVLGDWLSQPVDIHQMR